MHAHQTNIQKKKKSGANGAQQTEQLYNIHENV